MDYENKELNIFIENALYFKVEKFINCVQLLKDGKVRYEVHKNSCIKADDASHIVVYGNSRVSSYSNSCVIAHDNSFIHAHGHSIVTAYDNSRIEASDNSIVQAYGSPKIGAYCLARIEANGSSYVKAFMDSHVKACGNSRVVAHDRTTVIACDETIVEAHDKANVVAYDSSTVSAYDKSCIEASNDSRVTAYDFSIVYARNRKPVITKNHYGAIIKQVFKVKKNMVVYKKLCGGLIAELELENDQTLRSEDNSECYTDKAKVIRITGADGKEFQEGLSLDTTGLIYRVGQIVTAEDELESGKLYFFLNRKNAENY